MKIFFKDEKVANFIDKLEHQQNVPVAPLLLDLAKLDKV